MIDAVVLLSTGAGAEGSDIPTGVPVEDVVPETQEAAGRAPEPMEVTVGEAAATTGGRATTRCQNLLWRWSCARQRSRTRNQSARRQ
jgi:hypothetical protein